MVAIFWTAKEKSKYVNHGNLHFRYVLCWWKGRGDPAGVIIFSKKIIKILIKMEINNINWT